MSSIRTLALAIVLLSPAARAGVQNTPPAGNSTTPACISLVGSDGASPAQAFGQFEVVVRDLANNPVVHASVVVDFSSSLELFIASAQLDPDMTVDCANRWVSKFTDANGRAMFCILGAGSAASPAVTLLGGGKIFANGTLIGTPTVSAFDLDGTLGLGSGDLSAFLSDFASGINYGRSDFDCSDALGAGDLSLWLKAFASGTQVVSAVACP
jgi:hypothetical protein